jgi:hypothetical protein
MPVIASKIFALADATHMLGVTDVYYRKLQLTGEKNHLKASGNMYGDLAGADAHDCHRLHPPRASKHISPRRNVHYRFMELLVCPFSVAHCIAAADQHGLLKLRFRSIYDPHNN